MLLAELPSRADGVLLAKTLGGCAADNAVRINNRWRNQRTNDIITVICRRQYY